MRAPLPLGVVQKHSDEKMHNIPWEMMLDFFYQGGGLGVAPH